MKYRLLNAGLLSYQAAYDVQLRLADEVRDGAPGVLMLVEHHPVLTLGASFHVENLLFGPEFYASKGIEVVRTDRGGDVTYHGPGQLVIYPIFDVEAHGRDLHKWLRDLEEAMLRTLFAYGVEGRRFPPYTGAWVGDRKIAAIGIKVRRWVSIHGIALNCDNDLQPFRWVTPCGIRDYGVTSLTEVVGRHVAVEEAMPAVADAFAAVFGVEFERPTDLVNLAGWQGAPEA